MKVEGLKDTIDWYDKNAEKYADSAEQVPPIELLEKFLSMLPQSPNVLDAGCGPGRDSRLLHEKGAVVTGVDISKGLLQEATKRSEGVTYVEGDITAMVFVDSIFDGVWSHASLVHLEAIEDVTKALSEFSRVLKSGGVLHVFVKAQTGNEKTAVVSDALSNHDRFFRYYTEQELRELVANAGFEDMDTSVLPDPHGRSEVTWIALFAKKK
jgi:ubiquinone/menaquinone biosynthesis C-methylase UbiE